MVGSIGIAERAKGDAGFDEIVKRKAGGRRVCESRAPQVEILHYEPGK